MPSNLSLFGVPVNNESVQLTHQEEAGADKLPAQPPVPSRSLTNHLLDVITESVHS